MASYDEDVSQNPFFIGLQTTCKPLYETASANRWMIFVPKAPSVSGVELCETDFLNHVLQPSPENEELYKTLSDKEVKINGNRIIAHRGFSDQKQVTILFEETFFNKNDESFRVLCISRPLDGLASVRRSSIEEDENVFISPVQSVDDCARLLWGNSANRYKTQRHIENLIDLFNKTCKRLEKESLRYQIDAADALYSRCLQVILKDSALKKKLKENGTILDNLKLALETYILHSIYKTLFTNLSASVSRKDAEINKITRNLKDLQLRHLHIRQDFMCNVPKARKELSAINSHSTALGKLNCIKRVVWSLSQMPKQTDKDSGPALTSDDLLPILIFLVVKSDLPNWWANFTFMKNCRFSKCNNDDEFGFYLASLEAALEHVCSEQFSKMDLSAPVSPKVEMSSSPGHSSIWSWQESSESDISLLFKNIHENNLDGVIECLNHKPATSGGSPSVDSVIEKLCHPLCRCEECTTVLITADKKKECKVTIFSRDGQGATVLHAAAGLIDTVILEFLIQAGAVVNSTDYCGKSPLHVACMKGRQSPAFMLLHYRADVNLQDNDGNSPLHLATSHGHEDCVKALVFYDQGSHILNLNIGNDFGDTPLHLATRWGFEVIVQLLLENGAHVNIVNRRRQTPLQVASNVHLTRILSETARLQQETARLLKRRLSQPITSGLYRTKPSDAATCPNLASHSQKWNQFTTDTYKRTNIPSQRRSSMSSLHETHTQFSNTRPSVSLQPSMPRLSEQEYKIEKLFKHIADGDIHMVYHALGLSIEEVDENSIKEELVPTDGSLCHPLCQCKNCSSQQTENMKKAQPEGLSTNATNRDGFTGLHVAAMHSHLALVEFIVKKGTNINAKTISRGATALHLACQSTHASIIKVIRYLVQQGCKLNSRDSSGNTALHYCCLNSNAEPGAAIILQVHTKSSRFVFLISFVW